MGLLSNEQVLEGLRAALRLQQGEKPTQAELAAAPVLDGWMVQRASASVARLGGFVSGHPLIADGWCWTSVVLFIDPEERFARTVSRLYRLGSPFGNDLK
jgi:hypothetical protein